MIHQEMTFLVRHLAPTEHGLPIEIYVFSRDQVWSNYEGIQADIFDHILAIAPAFDLRVYQKPNGRRRAGGTVKLTSPGQDEASWPEDQAAVIAAHTVNDRARNRR